MSGNSFVYDFTGSSVAARILRNLGIEEKPRPVRRDLATTTTITNPVTCIVGGNMVEFSVDSTTKSYPVYMSDSLMNTNPSFDYGGFLNLASTVSAGTSTVTVYVHTFDTAGTYVFMNSLDNYQQTIIKVVASDATCPTSATVSSTTLNALYQLNLSTTKETDDVDMTFFIRLVAAKIGLLVLLVGFVTYMHSLDKEWTIFPFLKKKQEEEEEKERLKRKKEKEKQVKLKAEELRQIRDELAKHVEALRKRIKELEQARLNKLQEKKKIEKLSHTSKLLETLRLLKKDIKKRAKLIRNANGFDFEKDKEDILIQKKFNQGIKAAEPSLLELNKKKTNGVDDNKYDIPEDLRQQMDEDVQNREFQKLDRAQDDNRQQVSNYFDEERQKLEDRLRREGKLNEGEIENILNDYDMHTRDMAQMLQEDERRQQENFRRQLEARKARRQGIFNDIDKLKADRLRAKEIEAKEHEKHYEKMKAEENHIIGKVLVEEEKKMRKDLETDLEKKKKSKLKAFADKLKKTDDKDEFKRVLQEYNEKQKQVEDELENERKRALMDIERKMAERKRKERLRIAQMKPAQSSVNVEGIEKKIEDKMDMLKREADDEAAEALEEERKKRNISQELAMLRKQNDEQVKKLRRLNEQRYDEYCRELNKKYDESKLGDLIDLNDGSEGLQGMREELADSVSLLKRSQDSEEKKELEHRIKELKLAIANADKGDEAEKIRKNNKLLQDRAKLVEERENKKREFRWRQFEEEEQERDRLRDHERDEWIRREKEAIDAVIDKYMSKGDMEGLAEVLDQAYKFSKIYSDRLLDQTNKLQEKKARRLKYNFNANLDKKIHDIEELNRVMNPQLERLNAKKNIISEDDYKTQLKDLMMKENEKRAEIEALASSREQDSQKQIMLQFVDLQKGMVDQLNSDMNELRSYAFNSNKIKDKQMKNETKKLNEKYAKELERMKQDEEEEKKRQIDEIKNRFKQGEDELERNRKDFEMLSMFEKKLEDTRESSDRFKQQNKQLMMDQINKERNKLGKELTEDEKAILMARYERKMKNLNKALEKEHNRQKHGHSKQLTDKQRELEMKKRERELLLNSLSMYKDSRAEQIAYEDNFDRLCSMLDEDLVLIDQEAYSAPSMKIYDLVRWKREADEYLDVLGGDVDLLERVRRIEKYVANLKNTYNQKATAQTKKQNLNME